MVRVLVSGYGVMTEGLLPHLTRVEGWTVDLVSRHLTASPQPGVRLVALDDLVQTPPDLVLGCFESDARSREWWTSPAVDEAVRRSGALCVEMSTLGVDWVREWHALVGALGGTSLEAPVTGSRRGAATGTLSLFVHASADHRLVDPFLEAVGDRRYDFATAGHPTTFKLVYNAWGAAILETMRSYVPPLREHLGDDFDVARRVIEGDGWMAAVCSGKLGRTLSEDFSEPDFALELMVKDLQLASTVLAGDPASDRVRSTYEAALAHHGARADFSAVTHSPRP